MEKRDSVKFFLRFLLVTVLTFIVVAVGLALVEGGGFGVVIGVLMVVINVFFLLFFLVMAFINLIKHLFDKEREYFDFMHIVNFLFTVLITGVFLFFYFMIIAGAMVILLPFLA